MEFLLKHNLLCTNLVLKQIENYM